MCPRISSSQVSARLTVFRPGILFLDNWQKVNRGEKVLSQGDQESNCTFNFTHRGLLIGEEGAEGPVPWGIRRAQRECYPVLHQTEIEVLMGKLDPKLFMCLRISKIPTLAFHRVHQQPKLSAVV